MYSSLLNYKVLGQSSAVTLVYQDSQVLNLWVEHFFCFIFYKQGIFLLFTVKRKLFSLSGANVNSGERTSVFYNIINININKTYMSNPYYWQFPQRSDTMYMSTIQNKSVSLKKFERQSTFQLKDIQGAYPKQQIPVNVTRQNFNHSAYIQPRPQYYRSIKKISDPLKHDDIEKSKPQAVQFKTNRVVNPLVPRYKLASHNPIDVQPPAKFLRNTLDISDLVQKKKMNKFMESPKNEKIQGSQPSKLFRTIDAVSRLQVKDINNDGKFISQRTNNPIDPLNPNYIWRDNTEKGVGLSFTKSTLQQQKKVVNTNYGEIYGSQPKRLIPIQTKKQFSMYVTDIQGAHSNSYNQSRLFNDKRRQFRNYMNISDIQKTQASSLKKGITTNRVVNPLIPNYNYPS